MKESTSFPAILYHKEHAPEGKYFKKAEHAPAPDLGWVDTPAKFDPNYKAPEPLESDEQIGEEAAARGFVPVAYPTHLYRSGDPDHPKEVANAEAHAALEAAEPGVWKDTYDPRAWKAGSAPTNAAAPTAPPPASAAAPRRISPEQRDEYYKATIASIVTHLDEVDDAARLAELKTIEEANPSGARPLVLKAIKARAKALTAPAQ